ncbi:hypothetical protein REPUB_Repub06bG0027000 [Reevesia pubescens]
MEFAGAVARNIASEIVDRTVNRLINQIKYAVNYGSRVERLEDLVNHLKCVRERVQYSVDAAKMNLEEIRNDVEYWLISVDRTIKEVMRIMAEKEEMAKKKCLCPNAKSRYRLGKKAEQEAMAIAELLECGSFDRVSYRAPLPEINFAPSRNFEAFESRSLVFNNIMGALKDDSLSIIGVYGMGGVGKTTLVKEVAMQAAEGKLFDSIVMAAVSHIPDIQKIQDQIAEELGLKLEERSVVVRAGWLRLRLKKEKKILVILDDIWARLDLMAVGIPFGDEHAGCKILLTSRNLDVLHDMDAPTFFEVDVLKEEEAWSLFKKMAGDSVESPEFRFTAKEITKRCAGLPISITTVARALRNKGLFEWMDALRQLKRSSLRTMGMQAELSSSVELSYEFLESEEVKQTFLLCSLLGHHAAIQDLLKYTMGLGLFSGLNTVEETRNRLLTVVRKLKASSLLHDSYTNDRFDMHDLIYDVARSIASRDNNVFALKPEDVLTDWPDRECQGISLQYATVMELPDELKCPRLTFFYMGNKNPSLKMPPDFFKEMKNLRVLVLTKMHFSSLPSSICLLTDLCSLCLDQCVLGNIAMVIGKLKNLETLSLLRSDIEALPSEIGLLFKLKLLDLTGCTQLKVIPSNVLSRLSRLEELYLGDSFVQWRTGRHDEQRSYASLTEFRHLLHLSTLEVHIRDDRIMPKDLFLTNLVRYKVFIGDVWDWSGKFEYSSVLKLKLNTSINLLPGVKILLKNTKDLYLDELKGVKNVLYELNEDGFPRLKNLHAQNNLEILYIVNTMERHPVEAFPLLESLFLHNLINLEKICHGQLGGGSFRQLRKIKVRCCGRLMNLLSVSMVKGLHQLQELEVTDCKIMMELVCREREGEISEIEATAEIKFPQLRFLTIQHLPKLISLCSDEKRLSTSQQGKVQLTSGTRSRTISLFDEKVVFCKLEYLKLCALNIQILWHDRLPEVSSSVENLTTLVVDGCNNLKYLFSSFTVKVFVQLKNLEISGCESLEEVIVTEESSSMILLTKLVSLSLHDIPKLKRFCFGNCVEFPILRELRIRNCPLLNVFIPSSVIGSTSDERVEGNISREYVYTDTPPLFDDQVAFPSLEKLIIIDLRNLKKIWHSKCKSNSFSELKYLEVGSCEELKNIFPIEMLARLQKLNELHIYNCDSLEVIVEPHEVNAGESDVAISTQSIVAETATKFVFQSVAYLQLYMLPKLRSFYPKLHATGWPSLQKIQVCGCDKVHIFASEILGFQKAHEERHLEMSVQKPLFWVDKATFPFLQELWLEQNAVMKEIWRGQLTANQYFPRLNVLKLIRLPKESTILSSCFLSFSKIPKLIVSDAPSSEIFHWEGFAGEKKHAWTLDQISELSLSKLPELTHLWMERFQHRLLFRNLKTLKILGCGRLRNLVPSSVAFENLTTLEVSKCHGFINLITPSTARSMVQITIMSITDCKLIEEIIACEGDELMNGIAFPKLKYLELQHLPSLTSFYTGNSTFHLPSSVELIVRECPKLENFSKGESRAEMLERIHLTEENSRTKDLHMKKVC